MATDGPRWLRLGSDSPAYRGFHRVTFLLAPAEEFFGEWAEQTFYSGLLGITRDWSGLLGITPPLGVDTVADNPPLRLYAVTT